LGWEAWGASWRQVRDGTLYRAESPFTDLLASVSLPNRIGASIGIVKRWFAGLTATSRLGPISFGLDGVHSRLVGGSFAFLRLFTQGYSVQQKFIQEIRSPKSTSFLSHGMLERSRAFGLLDTNTVSDGRFSIICSDINSVTSEHSPCLQSVRVQRDCSSCSRLKTSSSRNVVRLQELPVPTCYASRPLACYHYPGRGGQIFKNWRRRFDEEESAAAGFAIFGIAERNLDNDC
jgi:hypothetical protein